MTDLGPRRLAEDRNHSPVRYRMLDETELLNGHQRHSPHAMRYTL